MAYIEEGTGDPIGMGDSDKLDNSGPDSYAFVEQRKYLFALLEQLGVTENVTLVIHDWGSGLGFHWAHMHPDAVKGIAFMEAIVGTRFSWDEFPERARETFQALRSPAGEDMVLQKNLFVEGIFPASILRKLEDEEMAEYRRPFAKAGEDRRPTLTWPRQIPVAGDPADVSEIVDAYVEWLATTPTPKLFVNAEPGMLITGPVRDVVRKWPNLTEVTVPGLHFIQEDSPDEIGEAIRDWHANL